MLENQYFLALLIKICHSVIHKTTRFRGCRRVSWAFLVPKNEGVGALRNCPPCGFLLLGCPHPFGPLFRQLELNQRLGSAPGVEERLAQIAVKVDHPALGPWVGDGRGVLQSTAGP